MTWIHPTSAGTATPWSSGSPSTLEGSERYPVLPRVAPGDVVAALPRQAPEQGEPFEAIFADFERVLVPALTHWNHPGFFGYFAITASAPGVLAEFLSAALNQQAMLWRTSPAATELEEVAMNWLRDLMGLPAAFEGVIYDTASIATLHALAAAREACVPGVREHGLAGRSGLGGLRVLLLRARALVGRQGDDPARARTGVAAAHRRGCAVPDAARRAARSDRGGPRQRPAAACRRRDGRHDVDDQRGSDT